jgi:chitin disaccharide deacetylase
MKSSNYSGSVRMEETSTVRALPTADSISGSAMTDQKGLLIVNADDWGRDRENTERTHECIRLRSVSSVSAMVFMEDSERAASVARDSGIDAGLHLNFTTPFSAPNCPALLADRQREVCAYLLSHRLARGVFHPGLVRSFDYVAAAQMDEFRRLYQRAPSRLDGHHHMHLCANVFLGKLLPRGAIVRRNESFLPSEKGLTNRLYRHVQDRFLAQRHRVVDFFFTLAPLRQVARLHRMFSFSRKFVVELETHPVKPEEYRFLTSGEIFTQVENLRIAPRFALAEVKPSSRSHTDD